MLGLCVLSFADRGHALAENAWSVGHGSNYSCPRAQRAFDLRSMHGCGDRNDKLVGGNFVADLFHQLLHNLGLHADEDNVSAFDGREIVGGDSDSELVGKFVSATFVSDGGPHALRGDSVLVDERLHQDAAHLPGAEYGDAT